MASPLYTRIISGKLKNKKLPLPHDIGAGKSVTPSKMKEAAMSMATHQCGLFEDVVFYDLFAGSGQMGIEALSRGAAGSVFIEWDLERIRGLKSQLHSLGLQERASVYRKDGIRGVRQAMTVEIPRELARSARNLVIYADPPYGLMRKERYFADLVLSEFHKTVREYPAEILYQRSVLLLQLPVPKTGDISGDVFDRIMSSAASSNRYGKNALALFIHDRTHS